MAAGMDNGEEIQGLDEGWTFGGANMMEWASGLVAFMVSNELFLHNASRNMPILLAIWIGTSIGLSKLRKKFPDEHRGIANAAMTGMGFKPPFIPAPASLQPLWSGCRVQALDKEKYFMQLGLDKVFEQPEEADELDLIREYEALAAKGKKK